MSAHSRLIGLINHHRMHGNLPEHPGYHPGWLQMLHGQPEGVPGWLQMLHGQPEGRPQPSPLGNIPANSPTLHDRGQGDPNEISPPIDTGFHHYRGPGVPGSSDTIHPPIDTNFHHYGGGVPGSSGPAPVPTAGPGGGPIPVTGGGGYGPPVPPVGGPAPGGPLPGGGYGPGPGGSVPGSATPGLSPGLPQPGQGVVHPAVLAAHRALMGYS